MQMVIEVRGLRKMYGSMVAVDDVSFDVAAGEIFGLLGPNGAGKTTTVECLQGLRHADGGQMRVLGLDPWTQRASLRRRIGSQLQESALPDRLKVWEALDLFATAPLSRVKREQLLEQLGLADKRNTSFANLSGGQRQRLFVALALVNQRSQQTRVLFTWDGEVLPRLEAVPHVYSVRQQGSQIEVEGDGPVLQHVASALLQQGIEPADLRVERPTLEEVFLQIVGKPEEEQ